MIHVTSERATPVPLSSTGNCVKAEASVVKSDRVDRACDVPSSEACSGSVRCHQECHTRVNMTAGIFSVYRNASVIWDNSINESGILFY